jgi:hypothetical protein
MRATRNERWYRSAPLHVALKEKMSNYDELMQRNLRDVFGQRDPDRRLAAIQEIYAPDATLFEPHGAVQGHAAISDAVSTLLDSLPPSFSFASVGPAVGHHGVARLRWKSGPAGGRVAVTGIDVAHIERDVIQSLYVFLDS